MTKAKSWPLIRKCRVCGLEKPKIKGELRRLRSQSVYIYSDASGSPWNGMECPDCKKERTVRTSRLRGVKHIDDAIYHRHAVGVRSEKLVKSKLENMGFKVVRLAKVSGPDLFVFTGLSWLTCEVKTVTASSRGLTSSALQPKRTNDDLVALVWPDERVKIETMPEFLTQCGRSTVRYWRNIEQRGVEVF